MKNGVFAPLKYIQMKRPAKTIVKKRMFPEKTEKVCLHL